MGVFLPVKTVSALVNRWYPSAAELEQLIDLFKRSGAGLVNVARSLLVAVMQHGVYPGFVRIVPRHGIYVCDWAEFGNVDTLISVLKYQGGKLDKGTAASLLETRTAIEGLAARLFISRCTNADILALRSIINDFRAEAQVKPRADVDKLAELACSFHRYICVKSGNNVIPLIVNGFHDVNMACGRCGYARSGRALPATCSMSCFTT